MIPVATNANWSSADVFTATSPSSFLSLFGDDKLSVGVTAKDEVFGSVILFCVPATVFFWIVKLVTPNDLNATMFVQDFKWCLHPGCSFQALTTPNKQKYLLFMIILLVLLFYVAFLTVTPYNSDVLLWPAAPQNVPGLCR